MSRRSRHRLPRRTLKLRRLLLALAILGTTCGAAYGLHSVQSQRQADHVLAAARAARDAGDMPEAVEFYRQHTAYRKRDAQAQSELAHVLDDLAKTQPRRWSSAAAAYESALNIDPKRADDHRAAGKLYLRFGQYGAARKHLDEALKLKADATDPEPYELLAQCDTAEDNAEGAKENYRKAVATGRAAPATYGALAGLLRSGSLSDRLAADVLMDQLVASRPRDLAVRLARSEYRKRFGDAAGSADDLRIAYAEIPGGDADPEVALLHGENLAAKDLAGAATVLAKGVASHPKNAALALGWAEVQRRTGDAASARRTLIEAAGRLPNEDRLLVAVGDRLLDLGDFDSAWSIAKRLEANPDTKALADYLQGRAGFLQRDYSTAIALMPDSVSTVDGRSNLGTKARLALGESFLRLGDAEQAETWFAAVLANEPENATARIGRAEAWGLRNRRREATDELRSLVKSNPTAWKPLLELKLAENATLPSARQDWGDFDRASALPEAVSPGVAVPLARSFVIQGRAADAEAALKKCLENNPKSVETWVARIGLRSTKEAADEAVAEAAKFLGDRVELRLAGLRALFLKEPPLPSTMAGFGNDTGKFAPIDRAALFTGIGEAFLATNRSTEAVAWLRKATAELRHDTVLRLALLDLALRVGDGSTADAVLGEIRTIRGPNAPETLVAEYRRRPPTTPAEFTSWKPRLDSALKQRGAWPPLRITAGDIALADGRADDALIQYRLALDHGGNDANLIARTVELLVDRLRFPDAEAVLERPEAKTNPDRTFQAWRTLARAAMGHLGREDTVKAARNPALAASTSAATQWMRGLALLLGAEYAEAKEALRKAKSLDDTTPTIRVGIVQVLAVAGEREGALAQAQDAQKRWQGVVATNPEVTDALATCFEIAGDLPSAKAGFRQVVERFPDRLLGWQRCAGFHRRHDEAGELPGLWSRAETSTQAEVAHWGRRERALGMLEGPDTPAERRVAALALIERNLKETNNPIEDRLALALVKLSHSTTKAEGRTELRALPLTGLDPEDNFHAAKACLTFDDKDAAAERLRAATDNGWRADPRHLRMLAEVERSRGKMEAATMAEQRLKLQSPAK